MSILFKLHQKWIYFELLKYNYTIRKRRKDLEKSLISEYLFNKEFSRNGSGRPG